jgi:hypothetical protein
MGWVTLFDGKDLSNWNTIGNADWKIEEGAVVATKGDGFLISKTSYKDFQIKVEFWVDEDGNSGVFIPCIDPQNVTGDTGYEVNIFDKRPDPTYGTGAIANVAKVDPVPKAGGKWNTYEITARGSRFVVVLNGTTTADAQDDKFKSGYIGQQYAPGANDAGVVKFRRVEITRL